MMVMVVSPQLGLRKTGAVQIHSVGYLMYACQIYFKICSKVVLSRGLTCSTQHFYIGPVTI